MKTYTVLSGLMTFMTLQCGATETGEALEIARIRNVKKTFPTGAGIEAYSAQWGTDTLYAQRVGKFTSCTLVGTCRARGVHSVIDTKYFEILQKLFAQNLVSKASAKK